MNACYIDGVLMKYVSSSKNDSCLGMAYDGRGAEPLASLKSHVFSCNANSSAAPTSIHQVNCVGTTIYSSQNQVAPPSEQNNTNLASIKISTATSDNFTSTTRQDKTSKTQDKITIRPETNDQSNASLELNDVVDQNGALNVQVHERTADSRVTSKHTSQHSEKLTPIVIITPASNSDNESDMSDTNGEVEASNLDCLDTCSLSSACSEDDIPTDDDPSESDSSTQPEPEPRKISNWKKIRRVIHWSPFVQNFKKKYPWVQLAGHQGSFKAGDNGNILKKYVEKEKECLEKLMKDILRPYVPEFKKEVVTEGEKFIEMQDLLQEFENPCIMDCKMGVRTYLEEEVAKSKTKPRKDLYQKMVDVDPSEPSESEHNAKAITKPRYMQWRERLSSSATLGFRIEGIKKGDQKPNKDFKKTKTQDDVAKVFTEFIENDPKIRMKYLRRLKAIRATLEASCFFRTHEVIGSSLLFVHDSNGLASIWMIDFGKTVPLHDGVTIDHRSEWQEGNHEDGYLWGLDKMIEVWTLDSTTEKHEHSNDKNCEER